MPELMKDGKKVIALAQNGLEFYPIAKNNDGSITIDGKSYSDSLIGKRINTAHINLNKDAYTFQSNDISAELSFEPIDMSAGKINNTITSNMATVIGRMKLNDYDACLIDFDDVGPLTYSPNVYFGNHEPEYTIWIKTSVIQNKIGGVNSPAKPHCIKAYVTSGLEVA